MKTPRYNVCSGDYMKRFEDLDLAILHTKKMAWAYIYDTEKGETIYKGGVTYHHYCCKKWKKLAKENKYDFEYCPQCGERL